MDVPFFGGEETPPTAKGDFSIVSGKESYEELKGFAKILEQTLVQVKGEEGVERSTLSNLITVVQIIGTSRGKEETLLTFSLCPKCRGKITETQNEFGGDECNPEPTGIFYRVGCEKCDYVVHTDTINI